jgi:transketolase
MVVESLKAAAILAHDDIRAMVINCPSIKPLDEKTLIWAAKKTRAMVTVEEHQISGGMGSAIAELLGSRFPIPIKRIGMKDCFGESGKPDELLAKYGMNASAIVGACRDVMAMR